MYCFADIYRKSQQAQVKRKTGLKRPHRLKFINLFKLSRYSRVRLLALEIQNPGSISALVVEPPLRCGYKTHLFLGIYIKKKNPNSLIYKVLLSFLYLYLYSSILFYKAYSIRLLKLQPAWNIWFYLLGKLSFYLLQCFQK